MEKKFKGILRTYLATGALIGWVAVILQLYLSLMRTTVPLIETLIRFFSYFTILTNILVAFYYSALLFKPSSKFGLFCRHAEVPTALCGYIIIVSSIYYLFLRNLWNPTGLQLFVDELLHSVAPVLFMMYWVVFIPKQELHWKNIPRWLIFPLAYLFFILFRGFFYGHYPYPFLYVPKIGYSGALENSALLFLVYILISIFLVSIGKLVHVVLRKEHK